MTIMKTAESFQATYVVTSVPKTASVGKQWCKDDTKSMIFLMTKATEPTPAKRQSKKTQESA